MPRVKDVTEKSHQKQLALTIERRNKLDAERIYLGRHRRLTPHPSGVWTYEENAGKGNGDIKWVTMGTYWKENNQHFISGSAALYDKEIIGKVRRRELQERAAKTRGIR